MLRAFPVFGLVAIIVCHAAMVGAQGLPGTSRMSPTGQAELQELMLLKQFDVQQELGLTDTQNEKLTMLVDDLLADLRSLANGGQDNGENAPIVVQFTSMDDLEDQLGRNARNMELRVKTARDRAEKVFGAWQSSRMMELSLQARGGDAVDDPEVMRSLDLSSLQKTKLQNIRQQSLASRRNVLLQSLGSGDLNELREQGQLLKASVAAELLEVLTPQQKETFEQMKGKPFSGNLSPSRS